MRGKRILRIGCSQVTQALVRPKISEAPGTPRCLLILILGSASENEMRFQHLRMQSNRQDVRIERHRFNTEILDYDYDDLAWTEIAIRSGWNDAIHPQPFRMKPCFRGKVDSL